MNQGGTTFAEFEEIIGCSVICGGVDQDIFSVHMLRVILFYSIGVLLFCVRKIIGSYRMCDRINRLVEKIAVACIEKKE